MKREELKSLFCRTIGPHIEGDGSDRFYKEGSRSAFRKIAGGGMWKKPEQKRSGRDITAIVQIKVTHG